MSRLSLIIVLGIAYMVPSRLIGHRLVVRIFDDRLEFFAGHQCVHRGERSHDPSRRRWVSYHHCIDSLVKKPGAFARLIYRDDLHPGHAYARTWERLRERLSEYAACRTYVRLLHLAHRHACEGTLGARLEALLASDDLPNAEALRAEFAAPAPSAVPILHFRTADPAGYDVLRGVPASSPSLPASPPQAASA